MAWDKDKIVRENGDIAEAQAPVIISASRSTDIPAFMQIGSSTDWKKDIQHGRIHSMASKALFHTKTHVSSYSGQKIQNHLSLT